MRLVCLDTETTGLDETARMVSLAMKFSNGGTFHRVFNPGVPIPPEASAVHGYRDEDVEGSAPVTRETIELFLSLERTPCVVAIHNADFDIGILRSECRMIGATFPDVPVLDTLRLARRLLPDAANHKLATLHHLFRHDRRAAPNHSAIQDCEALSLVASALMLAWIDETGSPSLDGLLAGSIAVDLPKTVTFGKFLGKTLREVDFSYLHWWLFKRPRDPAKDNPLWDWAFAVEYRNRVPRPDLELAQMVEDARTRAAAAPFRSSLPEGWSGTIFDLIPVTEVRARWEEREDGVFVGSSRIDSRVLAEVRPGLDARWAVRNVATDETREFARIEHAFKHVDTL